MGVDDVAVGGEGIKLVGELVAIGELQVVLGRVVDELEGEGRLVVLGGRGAR